MWPISIALLSLRIQLDQVPLVLGRKWEMVSQRHFKVLRIIYLLMVAQQMNRWKSECSHGCPQFMCWGSQPQPMQCVHRNPTSSWVPWCHKSVQLLDCSIYASVYVYTHTYIHPYIHTSIHPYIHTSIHPYIHTYIPTYLHTYIPTYLHTYIPTYLPTYIHTYITYIPLHTITYHYIT